MTYVLVNCDRPGCSKLHGVRASRSARPLGADALTRPHGPTPATAHPVVVSPPPLDGFWGSQSHVEVPARVRRAGAAER